MPEQPAAGRPAVSPRGTTALTVGFFAAVLALVAAIMLELLPRLVPELVAGRIARNSEGIVLLLLLAGWIQFVRPHLTGHRREVVITVVCAAVALTIGLVLFATDWTNRVKTLNETFLAASVLLPYVQLRRPIARWIPLAIPAFVIVLIVTASENATVILIAEALGALVVTMIALDLVDRGILEPRARTRLPVRLGWYALLAVGPVVFWQTDNGQAVDGGISTFLGYAGRTTEVFLCVLALQLYFAVGHGRTGVGAAGRTDRAPEPAPVPAAHRVG